MKKDALYKPLLRKFRAFFRKIMDSVGLSKGCFHWPIERLKKQVKTLMTFLELPNYLIDEKTFCQMAIILFPAIRKSS